MNFRQFLIRQPCQLHLNNARYGSIGAVSANMLCIGM